MEAIKSLVIAIGLVMLGLLGSAAADDYSGTFAGTFQENRIDLNDDGVLAGWDTARADTTLGQLNFQDAVERQPVADPTIIGCPVDQPGFELVFATSVSTFADTSQIFEQTVESPLCFDPATGLFTGTFKNSIVGGTGRYAGATGSIEGSFTGFYHVFDDSPESNQGFGSFTGSFTGEINIPDGGDGESGDCNEDGVVNGADLVGAGCEE